MGPIARTGTLVPCLSQPGSSNDVVCQERYAECRGADGANALGEHVLTPVELILGLIHRDGGLIQRDHAFLACGSRSLALGLRRIGFSEHGSDALKHLLHRVSAGDLRALIRASRSLLVLREATSSSRCCSCAWKLATASTNRGIDGVLLSAAVALFANWVIDSRRGSMLI